MKRRNEASEPLQARLRREDSHHGPITKKRKVQSSDPVLKEQIKHTSWQQIERYAICLYGNRDILRKGDIILTNRKDKGLVEYFTQSDEGTVTIHLFKVKLTSELPDKWRPFLVQSPENGRSTAPDKYLILTDEPMQACLGDISKILLLPLSPFQVKNDCLRERQLSHDVPVNVVKLLIDTYLISCRKMLHLHPLVQAAARSVSFHMSPHTLVAIILNAFYPFASSIANDEEDEKKYDFTDYTLLNRMNCPEGKCSYCLRVTKLAFTGVADLQVCEMCYVQMRELYRIFPELERARELSHVGRELNWNNMEMEADDLMMKQIQKLCRHNPTLLGLSSESTEN